MKLIDVLIIAVILVILGFVAVYLHRARKKGSPCIGCPNGGSCGGSCDQCKG